jgi:glycerophosphoryl diester phosphodiesterase
MIHPVAIVRNGRRIALKWHRGRRRRGDVPFTLDRIAEGMRLGASVEIDLRRLADGGFAVIHDATLDRETTGSGPVSALDAAAFGALKLRDDEGRPTAHGVLTLDALAGALAAPTPHPEALLQLDLKENAAAIDDRSIARFAEAVAPIARSAILSAHDVLAVRRLAQAVPGLAVGYDPCTAGAIAAAREGGWGGFVESALRDAPPGSTMVYLSVAAVLEAFAAGFDLVAAFRGEGLRVDAWTIRRADAEGRARAEAMIARGVDQITTDDAEGLAAALTEPA